MHPFDVLGGSPVCHSHNFVLINAKFPRTNHMAKVLNTLLAKITLLQLSMQFVLPKAVKHLSEIPLVIF